MNRADPPIPAAVTLQRLSTPQDIDLDKVLQDLQLHRRLPFWLFYDDRGSELFRQITSTPEYYLTRTEKSILQRYASEMAEAFGRGRLWIEPGAGCCDKAAYLLSKAEPRAYVAIDISEEPLQVAAEQLASQFPDLPVYLLVADFQQSFSRVHEFLPAAPRVVFYPGSSVGNFTPEQAVDWLARLRRLAGENGELLLGFDLLKDPSLLEAAYNDADGVTAEFHLNLLQHLQDLGVQLDPSAFVHSAVFNRQASRIEMRLQITQETVVTYQQRRIQLRQGEQILTEYAYKFSLEMIRQLAADAGWQLQQHWTDDKQWFALARFTCA
ncbi:L-histidine N(alpha)-methyltransferase [Permianibacter aggregans]|uniref:Dimethylhistidine N-methyltransferase n=1 Tax=Permianibacter aggregans TaxID=1510150 RepID=A0A4R6UCX8_9GAMM|nr:L-histidine N(alpha)-methyltransferase [Permianibacter aggregans]QGX40560.1 L-histidine N(alpha)-methyltransferase [Permianibacter aggregans]TDQ43882.1 dimethylhistidine N-methyltransferase [Permianibacter aggregans]